MLPKQMRCYKTFRMDEKKRADDFVYLSVWFSKCTDSRVVPGCKHHLCEPDLKLVWPSAKLLQAACSASNRAGHIITSAVMPLLTEQYHSRTEVTTDPLSFKI